MIAGKASLSRYERHIHPPSPTHPSIMASSSHNPERGHISVDKLLNEKGVGQHALVSSSENQEKDSPSVSCLHTGNQGSRGSMGNNQV